MGRIYIPKCRNCKKPTADWILSDQGLCGACAPHRDSEHKSPLRP